MPSAKNLLNQRFGRLKVVEKTEKRDSAGCIIWKCECDCGNTYYVSSNRLLGDRAESCGCLNRERIIAAVKIDLTNQRFGKLFVVKSTDKRGGSSIMWECVCDCGNIINVRGNSLRSGNTKSCGCLQKEIRRKLSTIHGMSYTKEYNNMLNRRRREQRKIYDSEWTIEIELALKKFQKECAICGATENLTVDHVLPLSEGYGLKPGNVVILCRRCNSGKNNKNINDLPIEQQASLIWNAFKFKDHWQQMNAPQVSFCLGVSNEKETIGTTY